MKIKKMKIKTWNLFLESLESEMTPEILKLIEETKKKAEENGVEVIMKETKTVPYAIGDFPVSGYFMDYGKPKLAVATGKPLKDWVMVLAHEGSHMDQWIEKSPYWTNSFIDGREAVEFIDEWCGGKEFTKTELDDICKRSLEVELDCEKRTLDKAIEYNLPVNVEEEIQKANSYILFYTFIKEVRKWNTPGKAPYQVKEVWSKMPKTFNMDYFTVSSEISELYKKFCY
jgi:hypothetical protein